MAVVFKWTNTTIGDRLLRKGNTGWWSQQPGYYIGKFNTGASQGTAMWIARDGNAYSKMDGNSKTDARSQEKIFVVRYDGSSKNVKYFINGEQVRNHNTHQSFASLPDPITSSLYIGGGYQVAELLLFDSALNVSDRSDVESFLGLKWSIGIYNYGLVKRTDWVYEDRKFQQPIDFGGAAINARSLTTGPDKTTTGTGTGTNDIGGLWLGKLKIGNEGFIKTGKVTFGTNSDDGSVFWEDLDED
jgi:hypothetical protein